MKKVFTLTATALLSLPLTIFAAEPTVYRPLVGIPGVDANNDFDSYINALYVFSITIAALLAVIKIIIAGVKWMMTDVVTSKGEAKKDIQGALIGLLLVLAAVLILTVVNPDTANVNLTFDHLKNKTYSGSAATPTTLDTSKITTTTPTSGVTAKTMPASAGNEQQILFSNSCPAKISSLSPQQKLYSGPNGSVCLSWPAGKNIKDDYGTMELSAAKSHCTSSLSTLNGVFFTDATTGRNFCYYDAI
ncbi:MAG: hypothetical protein H6780_01835 [Candidatus Nomurabacteria bacterium]|nr:MAG: hypothetical protein H6780_01835 [Candidatus Nomurabacteria bacterium]